MFLLYQANPNMIVVNPSIVLVDKKDEHALVTSSRMTSTGENSNGKKVVRIRPKSICPYCGKLISKTTKHPTSACVSYFNSSNSTKEHQITETVQTDNNEGLFC